jgi:flagellar protein FliS
MAMPNPYQQYQNNAVMTASPAELTMMLYNGCIKFLKQAVSAIDQRDIPGTHTAITRAQDILVEFMVTLDMKVELSKGLYALYEYMHGKLVEANTQKDREAVLEVCSMVEELRDAWQEVVRQSRKVNAH